MRKNVDAIVSLARGESGALGDWLARISSEREAVDRLLESGEKRVYGFNTLFGPLDGADTVEQSQDQLLDSHLVGALSTISGADFRLIAASKLVQIANGGTGVSPELAGWLEEWLQKEEEGAGRVGAWDSSYGSGDVVPASWWLHNLRGEDGFSAMRNGDWMSMINGNFYGTAHVMTTMRMVVDSVAYAMTLYRECAPYGGSDPLEHPLLPQATQLPVSIRDSRPILRGLEAAWDGVFDALEDRAAGSSGNPIFVFDEVGNARPVSNSSFLDYRVPVAVEGLTNMVMALAVALQRLAFYAAEWKAAKYREESAIDLVQPPKVAAAELRGDGSVGGMGRLWANTGLGGVEDLCDGTVESSLRLRRAANLLSSMADVARENTQFDAGTMSFCESMSSQVSALGGLRG